MDTDFTFNCQRLWRVCKRAVTILDAPTNDKIILSTAALLLGTAAQESSLRWERQRGVTWTSAVGGFSKWQMEVSSIMTTRSMFAKYPDRAVKAAQLVFNDPKATTDWLLNAPIDQVLWALRMEDNDFLGVLFCREHYRRVPEALPTYTPLSSIHFVENLARYWKIYYNTAAGSGTQDQFMANWNTYCKATVEAEPLWK